MSTATATKPVGGLNDYIKAHADTDPKTLLDLVVQENERLREESKQVADVEIDQQGQFRPKNLAGLWRLGQMFAQSGLIPDHYKGNVANCAIGCQMALRCNVDILTFLQSSYIVHGKPGIESKLAIAMLNASGKIKGRIRFKLEGEGKNRSCTATVIDTDSAEPVSQKVDWAMVEAEGWASKAGSKWKTMPDLMFQYRAAMFLIRVSYPDVLMGMQSREELEDIEPVADAIRPAPIKTLDDLTNHLAGGNGSANGESAQQQNESNGEAGDSTTEPEKFDLEGAQIGFNACANLEEVGKFETECNGLCAENEKGAIAGMADGARDRIRASRGSRSNGNKQKELAGT